MEITLQKETLAMRDTIRRRQTELVTESDIIVPDTKPDIAKILQMDGRARITSCQTQGDRILISGLADYCILYVPEGADAGMLESMEIQLPFKDICTEAGAEDAVVEADTEILRMDSMLLNSRKLSVKGVLALHLCLSKNNAVQLTTGAEGDIPPEMKKKTVRARSAASGGRFTAVAAGTEEVPSENPPVSHILKTDASIIEEDVKLITGKMIVKGVVRLKTLYTAALPSMQPALMEHAIPFTEILDLPGTEEGMAYTLDYAVTDVYCEVDEDDESRRRFGAEVTMEIHAETMREGEMEILDDCFCPGIKTALEKEPVTLRTAADTVEESIAVRKTLSLPSDYPPIAAICTLSAKPTVTSVSVEGGTAQVEGTAEVQMLYLTENGMYPIEAWSDRIPFAFSTKTTAPQNAEIACRVKTADCGYTLPDASSADVRINLDFDMHFTMQETVENVAEIRTDEADGTKRPSVVIAFASPGHTLWDFGKKYGVAPEKIAAANALAPDAVLQEGMRLLIP